MELTQAIDLFLIHIKVERGLARNTIEAYAGDLRSFLDFCLGHEVRETEGVSSRLVVDFLLWLTGEGLSARSQARRLVAVRGLFKFLCGERYLAKDPTAAVELPRIPQRLPGVLGKKGEGERRRRRQGDADGSHRCRTTRTLRWNSRPYGSQPFSRPGSGSSRWKIRGPPQVNRVVASGEPESGKRTDVGIVRTMSFSTLKVWSAARPESPTPSSV